MSDMTMQQFCGIHQACNDGREWALANCFSMQDTWNTIKPEWLIWIATRPGVLTDRELRLFAVWSARQVQHMMTDPRSVQAIDTAERFANGNATKEELAAARNAARNAAWNAARNAARNAWAAARAAGNVARDDARDAAWDTAWAASRDAASAAYRDAQAEWLRKNTAPNFKEAKP